MGQIIAGAFGHRFMLRCLRPDGTERWREVFDNLIPTVGLNDYLDKYYKGSSYTAAHYCGLTGASPTPAAGDTMASHGGWTEDQNYSEANRQTLTMGTVAAGSVDNSAAPATFTMNTGGTAGGAFITTDNTKGGTGGVLVAIAAFTGGNRVYVNLDTFELTVTATQAST